MKVVVHILDWNAFKYFPTDEHVRPLISTSPQSVIRHCWPIIRSLAAGVSTTSSCLDNWVRWFSGRARRWKMADLLFHPMNPLSTIFFPLQLLWFFHKLWAQSASAKGRKVQAVRSSETDFKDMRWSKRLKRRIVHGANYSWILTQVVVKLNHWKSSRKEKKSSEEKSLHNNKDVICS